MTWAPETWRSRAARQLPTYPDLLALGDAEVCLRAALPVAAPADSARLSDYLAEVAAGRAFLLQAGDCAETFAEFNANKVRLTFELLLQMSETISAAARRPVVRIGRIAGQFAKPRSCEFETIGRTTLPAYRGDIINGAEFDSESRTPDPVRMLEAYRQSSVTAHLLNAYAAATYCEFSDLHIGARKRLGLPRMLLGGGDFVQGCETFTSHEALLLPYEEALTRFDPASEAWWSTSAHLVWIGERTRDIEGAHVEYARGLANSIGIKCGPKLTPDDLLRLIERLDPENQPGRLVLIGRFGAGEIDRCLPPLMRATRREGRQVIWSIDPMHGNTRAARGRKTRLVSDILSEIRSFFSAARSEDVHAGGVHLELTGAAVTECLGGGYPLAENELGHAYHTHCDPRLNARQAVVVAAEIARQLGQRDPMKWRAA